MQPRRHLARLQDVLALADRGVIDAHAGIIDRRMDDAVGIGLRRPDVIVDGLCERLARRVEFEDRDDLARLRLLDQVVIVEAPARRDVGAEAAAGVAGVAARPRPHVEDAHLQDVAGLGALDRHRAGEQMHADAFAGAAMNGPSVGPAPRRTIALCSRVQWNTLSAPGSSGSCARSRRWRDGSASRSSRDRPTAASAPARPPC